MSEPDKTCPPGNWQRPVIQIMHDLERYEALILAADAHFAKPGQASNIALRVQQEAERIRAKHKKEGAAQATETPQERAPAEDLTLS